MEENEKPFPCVMDGCRMRFTNEDHLAVHKKKHDMILNLGNGQKSNAFVADQTPTPSGFIRNCEAVGLWLEDLPINPFDETFRKAVEAQKSGNHLPFSDSLTVPSAADDTLHTPKVFPFPHANDELHHYKPASQAHQPLNKKETSTRTLNDSLLRGSSSDSSSCSDPAAISYSSAKYSSAKYSSVKSSPRVISRVSAATTSLSSTNALIGVSRLPPIKPALAPSETAATQIKKETVNVAGQSMQLLLRMPDGKLVQLVQESNKQPPVADSSTLPAPENGLAIAKMKLKQALKNNGRLPSIAEPSDLSRVSVPPPAPTPATAPCIARRESCSGDDDDGRRSKFRERNRAAAKRCREKRLSWVQDLEKRAEMMHSTNLQLQGEVTSLRAEVAQLKSLLLAHKNCPITQAMNNSQMINISCLPISTIQTCLLPTSQPSRIVYQSTASTSAHQGGSTTVKIPIDVQPPSPVNLAKRKRHRSSNANPDKKSKSGATPTNGHVVPNGKLSLEAKPGTSNATTGNANNQSLFMSFNHLLSLSACATNENNENMERFKSASVTERCESDEEDDEAVDAVVPVGLVSVGMQGASESKVIKLNPNAVRFRGDGEAANRDRGLHAGDSESEEGDC